MGYACTCKSFSRKAELIHLITGFDLKINQRDTSGKNALMILFEDECKEYKNGADLSYTLLGSLIHARANVCLQDCKGNSFESLFLEGIETMNVRAHFPIVKTFSLDGRLIDKYPMGVLEVYKIKH